MSKITITRAVQLPDPIRLARFSRAPELGPRVLFFSGGTALREPSRKLLRYTHNSIHLITPFDSGGSSAHLRNHFHMLAVGDLRNRLMALADRSLTGNPEILKLFAYRFPKDAEPADLRERLGNMLRGRDELVGNIPDPMRKLIRSHLAFFLERMPDNFELRGASIGNLILAGGFFNYKRHIDPVIYLFSKLVEAKGVVRPIISVDLHLVSELEDGTVLVGQHLITGKEAPPLKKPIRNVYLSASRESPKPVRIRIRKKVEELIRNAELICFPMGSFYSSIVANLLPEGVGQAISEADCPKVFIPNTTADPEQVGMNLHQSVGRLLEYLERGCTAETARDRLLNFVLIDSRRGGYAKPLDLNKIKRFGIEVLDVDLITEQSAPYLDDDRVLEHLLSLV
jgi:CofD-related protein of GAK system